MTFSRTVEELLRKRHGTQRIRQGPSFQRRADHDGDIVVIKGYAGFFNRGRKGAGSLTHSSEAAAFKGTRIQLEMTRFSRAESSKTRR